MIGTIIIVKQPTKPAKAIRISTSVVDIVRIVWIMFTSSQISSRLGSK